MADDDAKARAGKAYQVYDKLGNVFVNDGLYGAVSGVGDYLGAVASSPVSLDAGRPLEPGLQNDLCYRRVRGRRRPHRGTPRRFLSNQLRRGISDQLRHRRSK